MAKKQENTRRYLSAYIPEESKKYKSSRINWGGLNLKNIYNSGEMSFADGVNVSDLPYVDTQKKFEELSGNMMGWTQKYKKNGYTILGFYIFDGGKDKGNVYVVVYSKDTLKFNTSSFGSSSGEMFTCVDYIFEKYAMYNASSSGIESVKSWSNYKAMTVTINQFPYAKASDAVEGLKWTRCIVGGVVKEFSADSTATQGEAQKAYDYFIQNADFDAVRSIFEFNSYNSTTDTVGTDITKKILIFPDKVSLYADVTDVVFSTSSSTALLGYFTNNADVFPKSKVYRAHYTSSGTATFYTNIYWDGTKWTTSGSLAFYLGDAFPNIKYACVNNQRLYGVDDVRVYVSGYNNYADFALDTADSDYSTAAGAWAVTTQASASRGGTFTAIVGFGEEAIAFKDNYMYRITGTTNPFRLRELCAVGCVDARSICELDGRLYFASQNAIYAYRDGYLPTPISTSIEPEIRNVQSAVGYIEDNRYHVVINSKEYIYDTLNGKWTMNHDVENLVAYAYKTDTIQNAINEPDELVFATDTGFLRQSDSYLDEWSFQTDFVNNFTSDLKKPHKLQLMYEIDSKASMRITLSDGDSESLIYSCTNGESMRRINCARALLRCDDLVNYSIKISGSGYVKLHAMEIIYEAGGELFE